MTILAKLVPILVLSAVSALGQAVAGHVVNWATGEGIEGVEVKIHQDGSVISTFSTDASGRFTVPDLTDGDYTATYAKREYSPSITEQPFHVKAGADPVKLEARMMSYGRIAGRVIDGRGEPVAGARLQLVGSGRLMMINADGHGEFDIHEDLPPGAYKLSAAPVGHLKPPDPDAETSQARRWTRTYYPGVESEELASKIVVKPGMDVTGIEIKLAAVPAHAIRGTITLPDNTPAAKITITLGEGLPSFSAQSTQSRDDGTFQFESVPDGLHEITATAKSGDIDLRISQEVEVAGQDLDRVNIALAPPFTVTGKVIFETPDGSLAPAPPGVVTLGEVSRRPRTEIFESNHWGNPNAKGDFNITYVYPGTYIVLAGTSLGFAAPAGYFLDSVRAGGAEVPDRVVRLTGPLPIALVYKTNGGSVRGTVEHCASSMVWLFPREATLHTRGFAVSATCNATDQYEIDAVRPGEYYAVALSAANPSPFPDGIFDETLIALATPVTVRAGETVLTDLRLTARPQY